MSKLADVDPEIAKALRAEAQRQHRNLELIASENFVSAPCWRRRLGPHQQVRRGLPGRAITAGARSSTSSRSSPSPRQGAVRRRARQRAAPLGRPGQHGGLLHAPQAGRHVLGPICPTAATSPPGSP
jgi:hypothetical protein